MGFEDRQYTREDSVYGGGGYGGGNSRTGLAQYSIVMILIAINVIVWVADMFVPGHIISYWLALDTGMPWRVWTLLTYGFVHSPLELNVWHIVFNMFVLYMFGRPVAQRLGRHEFLRFYLAGIIVSGLVFFLWFVLTGGEASAVGASGATTAVLILFILWYPHQKLYLMGILEVPAWALGVGIIGYDLFRAFTGDTGVAWQAHIGGAAFAAAYLYFKWNFSWMTSFSSMVPKSKGNLSVYNPDAKSEKLRTEGDRILAKISEQGEESLSGKERKTLERYSKMLRNEK